MKHETQGQGRRYTCSACYFRCVDVIHIDHVDSHNRNQFLNEPGGSPTSVCIHNVYMLYAVPLKEYIIILLV